MIATTELSPGTLPLVRVEWVGRTTRSRGSSSGPDGQHVAGGVVDGECHIDPGRGRPAGPSARQGHGGRGAAVHHTRAAPNVSHRILLKDPGGNR